MSGRHAWWAVLALLVVWPLVAGDYAMNLAVRILIYSLIALSFSLLAGPLGWFSLCQTTFAGISGYAVAILGADLEWPLALVLPAALATSIAAAAAIGGLALRTRGVSFLMLTLAMGQVVWALSYQWVDVTGGSNGIAGVRLPDVAGVDLGDHRVFYALLAPVAAAVFYAVHRLYRSPLGLLLVGIRENEARMRSLGHPVARARLLAFVLAGAISGIAGIYLVYDLGIMSPGPLGLGHSVWVLTAAVLGGYRVIWGPPLGVTVLVLLESFVSQFTDRHMMVIGFVLLLCVLLMPRGMAETLEERLASRRRRQQDGNLSTAKEK